MKSLTVYFNSDKVYTGIFERDRKGLTLLNISSTLDPVDLDNLDSEISKKAINQISRTLSSTDHKVEELNVVLSNDNAFWTVMPGNIHMDKVQLKQLLELEIRNNINSANLNDFSFRVYPYGVKDEDDSEMILVVFIRNEILANCSKALDITGLKINYITIAQIATQNTIEYNYPDTSHLYDLLINVEEDFCDISLSNSNITYYYDLLKETDEKNLIEEINFGIKKLKDDGLSTGYILVMGTKLNKTFLEELNNTLPIEAKRINSFRFVRANLEERLRDYCIRTSHIYAPVVGGALNSFDKGIVIKF